MISPAIFTLLSGVGSLFPVRATQTTKSPFVVFHIAECQCTGTKQTASILDTYQVQFNVFSEQYADLNTTDAAIRAILDGYRGTVGTVVIDSARINSRYDNFDDNAQFYCRTIIYTIRVKP